MLVDEDKWKKGKPTSIFKHTTSTCSSICRLFQIFLVFLLILSLSILSYIEHRHRFIQLQYEANLTSIHFSSSISSKSI